MKKEVLAILLSLAAATIIHAQTPSKKQLQDTIYRIAGLPPNRSEEKLVRLKEAEKLWKKYYAADDSVYCYLLRQIGFTCSDLKDFENAAGYFRQSNGIIVSNSNSPSIKKGDLINAYFWLSTFYDSLNNVAEKIKAADNCIKISIDMNRAANISCIRSLYAKVEYLFDIGDYFSCINASEMCEKYAEAYISSGPSAENAGIARKLALSAVGWRVNAMLHTGNGADAEQMLAEKVNSFKKANLRDYLALTYSELAELYKQKGDAGNTLLYYKKAFASYRQNGDTFNCKQTLNLIGQEIAVTNSDEALHYYRKALQFQNKGKYREESNIFETLKIYGNIANLYQRKGMYDSAFRYFQVAFDQLSPGESETGIVKSSRKEFLTYKSMQDLSRLVIDKGDAYFTKYIHTGSPAAALQAMQVYKAADRLLNRIRAGQSDLKSKLLWRRNSHRLYEHAINLCFLQNNISEAFYFFERSTAVLLSDQLNEQRGLGSVEISKLVQVNKKIVSLQAETDSSKKDIKKYAAIQDELFANTQEKQRLEESIKANNPLYYQGIDTNYISPDDVKKKLLKDHQALVELFSGDSAVYCLMISSGNNYFHKINKKEFDSAVGLYSNYITDRGLLNRDFTGFRRISNHLYQLIFRKGIVPAGRIIISVGGRYFPFESLVTDNNGKDPVYFLADHAVSYTYSARYLMNDFSAGSASAKDRFLGVAPVHFNAPLPSLTGSDRSLSNIISSMGSSHKLIAAAASRNNFLQSFDGYKIIQLYTHASDTSDRKEPVIYLADSALYLSELITGHKPVTRLIVLSACETGKGLLYQGEGVFSFSRGFAALGIPSCIANLWSVDNISTYQLTELFYKYLAKEYPLDVALQKAKLEFLAAASGENKLPYYWSPAVLVGKSDPVKYTKSINWKYFLSVTLLAAAIIWWLWRYRRKAKQQDRGIS